jgi:hypothetical protein
VPSCAWWPLFPDRAPNSQAELYLYFPGFIYRRLAESAKVHTALATSLAEEVASPSSYWVEERQA